VNPWETSDPRVFNRLLSLGVDSICTNYPDILVGALAGR